MTAIEWEAIVAALHDIDSMEGSEFVAIRAAKVLHRSATAEDVPRLLKLLEDDSFFVREAAAWPLSRLAGAAFLRELLQAYQRGFDDGHDNDGFSTALVEMAEADPVAIRHALQALVRSSDESMQNNASWLLEFCGKDH